MKFMVVLPLPCPHCGQQPIEYFFKLITRLYCYVKVENKMLSLFTLFSLTKKESKNAGKLFIETFRFYPESIIS